MKKRIFRLFCVCIMSGAVSVALTSCENKEVEFDDFEYQTVYFAKQTPVRTIVLGDDIYDRTLDNEHRFQVYATLAGVWKNRETRTIQVAVDNTLCNGLSFDNGEPVEALPASYYQLQGNTITFKEGEVQGCVDVQLTDAFFNDPKSLTLNYVLPLRIVSAKDSLLEGKDYTLYAVNYINKYDGCWISHGTDQINLNGQTFTLLREAEYLEKNELRYLTSRSLTSCNYELQTEVEADGTIKVLKANLILSFDGSDNCTITTDTPDCVVSGSGKWERLGAKQAWGGKDRDQLTLNYTLTYNYTDGEQACYKTYQSNDILVMRDRQSKLETFTVK